MHALSRRALYWTPRVLGILFALFLSLFALDVFAEGAGFREIALALALHLLPTLLVVALLVLAWRREWLGALGFLALAVLYVARFWGVFPLLTYVMMTGPLVVIALLFLFGWRNRAELRPH